MIVTINVKLVNSKFNQAYADKENEGFETEDNIKFIWEDEFDVQGDVVELKVVNNTTYTLSGTLPNNKEFEYTINDMTNIECHLNNGNVITIPFSKKAINKTEKKETKKGMTFNVYLKSVKDIINPMEGVYILKEDFPAELLPFIKDTEEDEEE